MPPDEIIVPNDSKSEPQITSQDEAAFDALADSVFKEEGTTEGGEKKTEPVQKPITSEPTKEVPKGDEKTVQKPETTVTETPEQKAAKEAAAKQPAPDKEVDAIQPPRNLSPNNAKGWEALRSLAKTRGQQLATAQAEVMALKPQVGKPDPALQERLTTLEAELSRYKTVFQNERSPEFIERYDTKITANENAGIEILKRNGMSDEDIKKITDAGGISKIPKAVLNKIYDALETRDEEKLRDAVKGNLSLSEQKEKELEEMKVRPVEFEQKVKEEKTKEFQAYTKTMADHITTVTKDIPWCKIQEIPQDATPEVKARIEKENQFYKESEVRFQAMLYPADPVTRVETALAACLSFKLANDLEQMQTTAKHYFEETNRLQGELDAIKKAGITSRGGSNVPKGGGNTKPDTSNMSDDDAVEAGLSAIGA